MAMTEMNYSSGGGGNEPCGTYVNSVASGAKTISLPFTPSCVSVSMAKAGASYYLMEFKSNNVDKSYGQLQSVGTVNTTAGITIGTNQITIDYFSQYLDGYDVYWAAFE